MGSQGVPRWGWRSLHAHVGQYGITTCLVVNSLSSLLNSLLSLLAWKICLGTLNYTPST